MCQEPPDTKPVVPDELFHYTSLEGAKAILASLKLKLTPPNQLNDPFEFVPSGYDLTAGKIKRSIKCKKTIRDNYDRLCQSGIYNKSFKEYKLKIKSERGGIIQYTKEALENRDFTELQHKASDIFGIACFSATGKDLLMWSHYAKNYKRQCHHGVVIGFSPKDIISCNAFVKVLYADDRIKLPFSTSQEDKNFQDAVMSVLSTKATCWKYEEEWRIIARLSDLVKIDSNYFFNFRSTGVTRVIFGARTDVNEQQNIRDIIENLRPSVRIQQVKLNHNRFLLDIV